MSADGEYRLSRFVRNDGKTFDFCSVSIHLEPLETSLRMHADSSLHTRSRNATRTLGNSSIPLTVRSSGSAADWGISVILMGSRMKRNPRKVKWTKAFRRAAGKDMTIVRPSHHHTTAFRPYTTSLSRAIIASSADTNRNSLALFVRTRPSSSRSDETCPSGTTGSWYRPPSRP